MNVKNSVYVTRWDGNSWNELGGKDSTNFNISNSVTITNLAIDAYGNICANVGSGSTQYIKLWDGSKWNNLGGVFLYPTSSIITDKKGGIYITGTFKNNVNNFFVNYWDGISWGEVGVKNILQIFPSGINCIVTDVSGNVYAAPRSTNDSGKNFVTKWNGTSWSELGGKNSSTFNGWVNSICFDTKGNLYAGGYFTNSKGKYYVAKWNGTSWVELGWTIDSVWNRRILTLSSDTKGNVFAVTEYFVKKWNGTIWNTLDSGLFMFNGSFATDANNNIYAVTNSKIVSKYSSVGNGGFLELGGATKSTFNGAINNLITDTKGNLYAMGNFTNGKGYKYVSKWNGSSWSEVGGKDSSTFNNQIFSATIDKKSNIYVSGFFRNDSAKNYVGKYDGSSWSELGGKNTSTFSNTIYSITSDANSNIFASGIYSIKTGSDYTSYVAKYGASVVTPVTLAGFSAKAIEQNNVQLDWLTSIEINSSHFNIQHSTDGYSFTNIGTVKAIGAGANSYSFIDNKTANGINYYRLQSLDIEGSISYSKVVNVNFGCKQCFSITPNPARDFATIHFNKTIDKATIAVYDFSGKAIITQSLSGANSYKLNTQFLKSGVYVIKVNTTTGSYNEKLLINK